MVDYIVVGGGIGGTVAYLLLKSIGKNVLLFEKLDYLGGCAGTFRKDGIFYNVGASTLVGLDEKLPLDTLLKILKIDKNILPIKQIDPSIVVFVGDKKINRYKDFDLSFEEINSNFPHKKNRELWNKILKTSNQNWSNLYNFLPFNPKSPKNIIHQLFKNYHYLLSNVKENLLTAESIIKPYLDRWDKDYVKFLNSQILMTTQCYWNEVNFSFACMGLTYTNLSNYYVFGGMSEFLNALVGNDENVKKKTKVIKISKESGVYKVHTNRGVFETKRVILNKTIWDFCDILDDSLKNDLCLKNRQKYSKIWSSATLYFAVKDDSNLLDKHHYQIVHDEENPYTGSYSFFVSVADDKDKINGYKSVTISTHCKIDRWENVENYQEQKEKLKEFILDKLYERVPVFRNLPKTDIMVGTPRTFKRYTERYKGTVGGIPLMRSYTMFNYPVGNLPIDGMFLVGDSIFPGQGYPGVVLGVFNILLQIERDFHEVFYRYI
ncbi:MAG: phytoene desaturase family protein [Sulfurihydrogenibium sp.]|uniref:phytoene desaturase family protein n=1 Tax=Sulfurihydrogenibium sp. TaxID=2053621 RepID=UPI003D0E2C6B